MHRFCSDTCGVHYALNRLKTNKIEPTQVVESLATVIQPEGVVLPVSIKVDRTHMQSDGNINGDDVEVTVESEAADPIQSFLDRTAMAREANAQQNLQTRRMFEHRKKKIEMAIEQLSHQDSMLRRAIANAESLPELHAGNGGEHDYDEQATVEVKKSKKKKSKRTSTAAEKAAEARPCGFDMRLVEHDGAIPENGAPDSDDAATQNGERPVDTSSICLLPKKKCDRHSGYVIKVDGRQRGLTDINR